MYWYTDIPPDRIISAGVWLLLPVNLYVHKLSVAVWTSEALGSGAMAQMHVFPSAQHH